jgi:hypothetical protein
MPQFPLVAWRGALAHPWEHDSAVAGCAESPGKRPVKRGAVHSQERGHIFAAMLSGVDQLPGVDFLLRRQFRFAPEFHASASRGLHSGAGPFADKATFQFRQYANHLPHGAACRRLSVDCLSQRTKFHPPGL